MNARETMAFKTNSYVEGVTFADACAVLSRLLKGDLTDREAGS